MSLSPFDTYATLPPPSDAAAADVGFVRWREIADDTEDHDLARFMCDFAADATGRRLLSALFGNSPYLAHCCLREPALLARIWRHGTEATFADLIGRLNHDLNPGLERSEIMAEMRRLKRRTALVIAIADIAGLWPLEKVTASLSAFAEGALRLATRHLLTEAAGKGDIVLPDVSDSARDSGFIVIAAGKLGAGELNYSSDIDLILLFDPETTRYSGPRGIQAFFNQLAFELVRMMAERTAEGYVFRTDLRLRPDPGSTPPALSLPAAMTYYETAGQNWERAALIRARAVAGDITAGERFLTSLEPFLWRKHLDFAAIQDIHSIKRQIHAQRGGFTIAVEGHNIKLGRGGIREIEFFAQTQQLIWGGRQPELRLKGTVETLAALAAAGHIAAEAAAELSDAYRFLRRVEHRLQMTEDAQTHVVPADSEGLRRLAVFLGYPSAAAFSADLTRVLARVESHYARLFEEAPSLSAPGNLVFTGSEDDPETLETLARLGFSDPPRIAVIIRGWHHGRYRATHSQRARELLTELMPALLKAFGACASPDAAFLHFDHYLSRLPAGVQMFSLLYRNTGLLDLVAEIMGSAPVLAESLAQRPGLLEGVLAASFFDPLPPLAALKADLGNLLDRARHIEELLDTARRWVAERKFQVGIQVLRQRLDGEAAGGAFADIAEAAMAELLPCIEADFVHAHGTVEGGALAVLALGKLGGREMTFASDLDLILVYDAASGVEASKDGRPLPVATYYARLIQRFINALTALTGQGDLYKVDMRLRPSGTSGPIGSSFKSFRRYHRESAWTWEQMALTRARTVAGSQDFCSRVMGEVRGLLTRKREPVSLAHDIVEMRQRIADAHRIPNPFDVKHRRGGMVDIEFVAQYLQLRDAARIPAVLHPNTTDALVALAKAGSLRPAEAESLLRPLMLWRNLQSLLKLTAGESFDEAVAPTAIKALLARGAGTVDFTALKLKMNEAAATASSLYETLVEAAANTMTKERTR
jgi:[glutamine synthetase] adenylyltransferase / [glutamine synthetase]-adenylyl-L-tyrosine phosphorylase